MLFALPESEVEFDVTPHLRREGFATGLRLGERKYTK